MNNFFYNSKHSKKCYRITVIHITSAEKRNDQVIMDARTEAWGSITTNGENILKEKEHIHLKILFRQVPVICKDTFKNGLKPKKVQEVLLHMY